MIKAVLFDMDGVLVDSFEAWLHTINAATEVLGVDKIPRDQLLACFGQGVEDDANQFFGGCDPNELESVYESCFLKNLDQVIVDPDAARVLATLAERGIPFAVITNTPTPMAHKILESVHLQIEHVHGDSDDIKTKPAPDLVLAACKTLSVTPETALVVGDSRYDREAAAAAGATFVGVRIDGDHRIEHLIDLLELLPTSN